MKKTTNDLRIVHHGTVRLHNGESATAGEAAIVVNMREREDALEVVGKPCQVAQLMPGDKVLLVDGERTLVLRNNNVMYNDTVVLNADTTIISVHKVGALLVIVTNDGNVVLQRTATGYERLDLATVIPQIHITSVEQSAITANIAAFEFNSPYPIWQAPLASDDVDALTRLVHNAVTIAQRNAASQGRFTGVLMARYAVRLWDNSYLWMSQPVMIGHSAIASSYRSTATVTQSGGTFTGIESFDLALSSYRLGITMTGGIASEWRQLIKAIDVLITTETGRMDLNSRLDYRCVVSTSSGTRRYLLEIGPKPRQTNAMLQSLLNSDWRVAASTSVLDGSAFTAVNTSVSSQQAISGLRCDVVTMPLLAAHRVSRDECDHVMENCVIKPISQVSMQHNGRLYQAPSAFSVENPWHVLPWLDTTPSASTVNASIEVTLSTNDGIATLVKSGSCPCSSTTLNPIISFPDVRATHIAIAVGNKFWEADLAPIEGTGMAAYVNPSLHTNTMVTGSLTSTGNDNTIINGSGTIMVSAVGNPLVTQWRASVSGTSIKALGAACRPIYSGGFGRYPIYLFTTQGIMALPQSTSGAYGEPRLITEVVLGNGPAPVAGGDALWFISQHGILCSISGSSLKRWNNINTQVVSQVSQVSQMAWNDREQELWIVCDDGSVQILMPSGRSYSRNINVTSLYNDSEHALAVTGDGALLDLTDEEPAMQQVSYLSQPFNLNQFMTTRLKRISWNVINKNIPEAENQQTMTLTLRGERGGSCHGYIISQVQATGVVAAPLSRPIISIPSRTLRLQATACLTSSSLILPTIIQNT